MKQESIFFYKYGSSTQSYAPPLYTISTSFSGNTNTVAHLRSLTIKSHPFSDAVLSSSLMVIISPLI